MTKERALHRSITERWVVTGTLVLLSPAHFGGGESDPLVDMPLLVDEASGRPLLPGASIAGALRNYLREWETGYGKPLPQPGEAEAIKRERNFKVSRLLGGFRGDDEGAQSPLIVFDSVGRLAGVELRDGVKIDPETRTAEDKKKFDLQLLAAGTEFPLRFDLAVSGDGLELRQTLTLALVGLEDGEITLGARKRRGFGLVTVKNWQVWKYNLHDKAGLLAWLSSERGWKTAHPEERPEVKEIFTKLGISLPDKKTDCRQTARLSATFALDGTLMIRSGFGEADSGPDMVHLHSARPGKKERQPVIPGTSWAGILRHRALKIARTILSNEKRDDELIVARGFVDGVFGPSEIKGGDKNTRASRVSIRESEIVDSSALVVTRVKIDRFTGGAFESALFTEQPVVGKPETRVTLDLTLRDPKEAELGLLLLLLKDLWTGDLPIGGESGVGRGRLEGVEASLETPDGSWTFKAEGEKVLVTPEAETLEKLVAAFNNEMKAKVSHE